MIGECRRIVELDLGFLSSIVHLFSFVLQAVRSFPQKMEVIFEFRVERQKVVHIEKHSIAY